MSDRLPTWRIASPCSEAWDSMSGDDRVRRCVRCDQNVFSLSALSRQDAEALLERTSGQLCTTYFQRADGTVLTADCPETRWLKLRRRVSGATAVAAASLLTLWSTVAPTGRGGRIERTLAALADPAPPPYQLTGGAPPPRLPRPPPPDRTKHRPKPQPKPQPKE
jgi:hypothetical protein